MGVPRSSYYAAPAEPAEDPALAEIREIAEAFPAYRRVGAELRHRGRGINSRKIRRLMKENALNPWRRPRFVRTTSPQELSRPTRPPPSGQDTLAAAYADIIWRQQEWR